MRYYDLDDNGWPRASYARPQPDKELMHLPDQQSDHHRWDGEQWVEDVDAVQKEADRERLNELRGKIMEALIEGEPPGQAQAEYRQIKARLS